jgi:hypothetical protein
MSASPSTTVPAGAPTWQPQPMRAKTQRWFIVIVAAVVIASVALVAYLLFRQDIQQIEIKPLPAGADLAIVLAPILVAAAGIERLLESFFGIVEGNWKSLVAYLGRGLRWLHAAETEVDNARQWLANISQEYNALLGDLPLTTSDQSADVTQNTQEFVNKAQDRLDQAKLLMGLAEQRLQRAEDQLSLVTDSDDYKNAKRAVAVYLGLLGGLVVATVGSLQMFALMGVHVPVRVDVFITGLVVGSGTAPVHSLINILQSVKDTLDSAQDFMDVRKIAPPKEEKK